MKFGINTLLWTANFNESNVDLLPRLKGMGFDRKQIRYEKYD